MLVRAPAVQDYSDATGIGPLSGIELAANVWPVVDTGARLVLRYLMRAYAIEGPDEVIGATLRTLAPTDFRMARVFQIPSNFTVVSEYGTLSGCVAIGDFHKHQAAILAPAFSELEDSFARLQGIALSEVDRQPIGVSISPRFPKEPYLVVTTLIETAAGQLIPQVRI